MESELKAVIRHLVENRWPFRLHATYNETIERALNVYEEVNREIPFDGLHWFFDHCETITDRNIERVKALGGGIAVQNRMAFQGEYFVERYGAQQAKRTPPIRRMLEMGVPVGAGTDATRVSSYNPYLSLYWLITGKTIGGLGLYPEENRLDRAEALKLYTIGSSWFSTEDGKKGALAPGQLADLAVLSADYFSIPEEEIKQLESVLTMVGGKIVYATEEFSKLAPPALPVSPSWSPVKEYGGYARGQREVVGASHSATWPGQNRTSRCWATAAFGVWVATALHSNSGDGGITEMKVLFLSFVVGLGVGVLYGLIRVKSPAPPIVALLGLLGMVLGEQLGIWVKPRSSMFRVLRPSALSANPTIGSIRPNPLEGHRPRLSNEVIDCQFRRR